MLVDLLFWLETAFGDSDDGESTDDDDLLDNRDELEGPDSMDEPSLQAPVPQPQPSFDMVDFMVRPYSYPAAGGPWRCGQ
jgi:hypothetical protein